MNRAAKWMLLGVAASVLTGCGGGGTSVMPQPTKDPYALGKEYSDLVAAKGNTANVDAATAKIKTTLGLPVNSPTLYTDDAVQAAGPGKKFFAVYEGSNELFYISKDVATGKKQDTLIFSMTPDSDNKTRLTFVTLRTAIAGNLYRLDDTAENGNLQSKGVQIANDYGVQHKNETKPAPDVTPDNLKAIDVGTALDAKDYAQLSTLLNLPTTIGSRAVDQIFTAPAGSKFFATNNHNELFYVKVETANDGRVRHIMNMTFGEFSPQRPNWALKSATLFAQVRGYGGVNYMSDDADLKAKLGNIGTTFEVTTNLAGSDPIPPANSGDPDGIALGDAYEAHDFNGMSGVLGFANAGKVLTNLADIETQGDGVLWAYNPSAPGEVFYVVVSQNGRQFDEVRISFGHDGEGNLIPTELHGQSFNKSGTGLEPLANSAANGNLLNNAKAAATKVGAEFTNQSGPTAMNAIRQVADRFPLQV